MGTAVVRSFKVVGNILQKAGPYLLLELLLPGGTLFALLLFFYRRRPQFGATRAPRASVIVARVIVKVRERTVFVSQQPT